MHAPAAAQALDRSAEGGVGSTALLHVAPGREREPAPLRGQLLESEPLQPPC